MSIIYVITNQINHKQYVGKTSYSLDKRFKEHIYDSHRGLEYNKYRPLYMAFNKYGIENFIIEQLEEVPENKENEREQYWIAKLNTYNEGYNATLGGDGQSRIDKAKVLELYHQGYNNSQIASILGHERANISRIIKSFGLPSQFSAKKKVILQKDEVILSFDGYQEAAKYLIDNNFTRSKNKKTVADGIAQAIKNHKSYFGFSCFE